jgi:hypothetical protein
MKILPSLKPPTARYPTLTGWMALEAMMLGTCSSIRRFFHSSIARFAAVTLVALVWNSLAFCGEIHDAAAAGDLAKVNALIKDNPELVSSKDNEGCTPLHRAVAWDRKDGAELLLANRANINARDNTGWTALHWTALRGYTDVATLLLSKGSDINAKDKQGMTPLKVAFQEGQKNVLALLLMHGAGKDELRHISAEFKNNPGNRRASAEEIVLYLVNGMTREEIIELLGEPDIKLSNDFEWEYTAAYSWKLYVCFDPQGRLITAVLYLSKIP